MTTADQLAGLGRYEYGWADSDTAGSAARRGLNEEVVRDISAKKSEPQWMLDLRLKGLRLFDRKPMPAWGADLSHIDFDNIKYFVRSTEKQAASCSSWVSCGVTVCSVIWSSSQDWQLMVWRSLDGANRPPGGRRECAVDLGCA
jgi:hypothetical protein